MHGIKKYEIGGNLEGGGLGFRVYYERIQKMGHMVYKY
jgi:hypothetical protein